jgi:Big-like domain-containing protein
MPRSRVSRCLAILFVAAAAAVFVSAAGAAETVSFTAKADGSLTTGVVSSQAGVPLTDGVPVVFHSFGAQAAEFPAGFTTVPGPFSSGPFDAVVIAASAFGFSPQFAEFSFRIKDGTTNQLITETPSGVTVHLDDIPLDNAPEGAPAANQCDGDPFGFPPFYKAVVFQITLAPPVNVVTVAPTDDVQLIVTPVHTSGNVHLCVEDTTFFTSMGLVVDRINSAPVAADDSATTPKNTPVTIDVLGNDTDADGDALSVANLTTPAHGNVHLNADGTVTYTPNAGFLGTDTFTYTANDGTHDSNVATVSVEVRNTPPVGTDDSASTFKNTPVTINVLANDTDADGDAISVSSLGLPAHGTAALNADGTVTYSPNAGFSGTDTFTYRPFDGTDAGNVTTVTVQVINRPPDCSHAAPSVTTLWPPNGRFVPVTVLGVTDPDGDPVAITVTSIRQDEPTGSNAPDGKGVGTSTAQVRAERLGSGDGRVYRIGFTADDGDGGACSGTVRVGVPHDQGNGNFAVDGGPLFDSTT